MKIEEIEKRSNELKLELRQLIKQSDSSNDMEELKSINCKLIVVRSKLDDVEEQLLEARLANGGLDSDGQSVRTRTINDAEQRQRDGQNNDSRSYMPGVGFKSIDGSGTNINYRGEGKMSLKELNDKYEQRAADLQAGKPAVFSAGDLQELRSITVGSSSIVTNSVTGSTLTPAQLQVASIVDKVFNMPLIGGESFKQGYEILTPDAGVTTEDADSLDVEPTFGYVDINKLRFTSYAELTSQVIKLSPVQYSAYVMQAMQDSIRKVLGKHIVAGNGGTAGLAGIAKATTVSGLVTDIALSVIDSQTLDHIVFGYGGDLSMGIATLILKKTDLAAFASLRNSIGTPIYKIEFDAGNPNAGFISSNESFKVPYLITDQLSGLSDSATVSSAVTMCYGDLSKYFLVDFSPIEVRLSTDYQFKKGNTAFRGELYAGGAIAGYHAFSRIVKA